MRGTVRGHRPARATLGWLRIRRRRVHPRGVHHYPHHFQVARLELDMDCSATGEVWFEVRDDSAHPSPGYTLQESVSVDGNQVAVPVFWKERDDLAELMGRPVRLHFKLRPCKLYAFQFKDSTEVH